MDSGNVSPMLGAKDSKRSAKKVATFLKEKEKASKRYKAALAFTETEVPPLEEKKFFEENADALFSVFYETFLESEPNFRKGKGLKDLLAMLGFLKKFLVHLTSLINTRWNIDKIGGIIEKCLAVSNQQQVRLHGFELLLYFIEALQNSMEESQISLFSVAITLTTLITPDSPTVVLKNKAKDDGYSLLPGTEPPSRKDTVELLDFFLEFISNKSSNFLFWFNLFKDKYLMAFYPKIFQELRLQDKYDDSGFKGHCPWEVQAVIVARLAAWGDRPNIFTILWDSDFNGPIMIEIHRQTCLLPLSFATTIMGSTHMFRNWLMNFQKNKIFSDKLQLYWQQFIRNLALIFTLECSTEELDGHHSLCKEVLAVYTHFAVELSAKLSKETWEVLQYTILLSTFDLLNKTSPNSSSHSHTTFELVNKMSPDTLQKGNKNISLGDHFFGALYFFWIRSQINNDEMWKDLAKKVASLVNWKANLFQWKEKIVQLTYILIEHLYNVERTPQQKEDDLDSKPEEVFVTSTLRHKKGTNEARQFQRDPRLTGVSWTKESITSTWYTILNILGNITKISDPISYEIAMECVYEVVDMLVLAEEKLPLNAPQPIPIMKVFLPWLIEACVYDERLIKGMLLAYRTLCLLFARRHTTKTSAELTQLLSHFYRIIQMGLNNVKSEVICEIIENSTNIFAYDLPGVAVLIPDFLREIEVVCGPQTTTSPRVKQNALEIVNSLICYPNHFEGLEFPIVEEGKPYDKTQNNFTFKDIKEKVSKILLAVMSNLNENPTNTVLALCGTTVLIFEEMANSSPRAPLVLQMINALLECADTNDEIVSRMALECLSSLTEINRKLDHLDKNFVIVIVRTLCEKIITHIPAGDKKETIIANLFYSLRDWLLSEPNGLLASRDMQSLVFQAVEYGILGELMEERAAVKVSQPVDKKVKHKKGPSMSKVPDRQDIFEELKNSPTHGSFAIREAAEVILLQLLNQHNNSPSPAGPEVTSSHIVEYEEEKTQTIFFSYNGMCLLSFTEVPNPAGGKMVRLVMRDSTGKYCWDSNMLFRGIDGKLTQLEKTTGQEIDSEEGKQEAVQVKSTRNAGEMPKASDAQLGADMIHELLQYLSEAHPECHPHDPKAISSLDIIDESYRDNLKERIVLLEEHAQKEEQKAVEQKQKAIATTTNAVPPVATPAASTFHQCRLLLSHIGLLDEKGRKHIQLIDDNHRFLRSLKELDLIYGREIFKIGVIYVAQGQEDQREILKNESGSSLYNEFVKGLGWMVDLKTHRGYYGGLDIRNFSTGQIAPYYSNASAEVLYHVATLMPSSKADDQQIDKKKHIGNDYVHIVWSEHKREYRSSTITSNFNDCHIVIYPLPNGLFRIRINGKEKISLVGPILDGMVVNKKILCPLVRQTAIYASRRARAVTKVQKPFQTRNILIREMIDRYKSVRSFDDFMASLYPLPKPAANQPGASPSTTPSGWVSGK